MDYFDTHYYRLNRKLLIMIGQWPYQRYVDRVKIWILYLCIIATAVTTQVAKVTSGAVDFDLWIEFFSECLVNVLILVRYFVYTINNDKVRILLESMKLNWQSLMDDDENQIFGETAERGRLRTLYYTKFVYSILIAGWISMFSPPLLKYINLINDSYPRIMLYPAKYFIDEEKYYYLILIHMNVIVITELILVLASDTFLMVFMYHAIGVFRIVCHRLEHAFDSDNGKKEYASGRTNVCERMANAVEMHERATRFCNTLSAMNKWTNFTSLLLVLVNITVSLYWAVISKGHGNRMIIGLVLSIGQMTHILMLEYPAQEISDESREVVYKAYSGTWYMTPAKEQGLVLLTMQRGLKPAVLMMGNVYPVSLENYATEVKAAFSYFTVLMSLK